MRRAKIGGYVTSTSDSLRNLDPTGARPTSLKEADFVQSLARGLLVIRSFDGVHRRQTLSDVARRTGLTRATARRLLLTLDDLGYVYADGRDFLLAPAVLGLGYAYLSSLGAPAIAEPFLESLSAKVQESCSMCVLDGADVVYVARVPTQRVFSLALTVGSRLPAFVTSMGRVMLAGLPDAEARAVLESSKLEKFTEKTNIDVDGLIRELEKARAQGWYVLDEELELGLRSVAAPVVDSVGRPVAAINVSTPAARLSREQIVENIVPHLVETASGVSNALHYR